MVEKISSERDLKEFMQEREVAARLRNAISFCKYALDITVTHDRALNAEQK
jgi:hypothetical protein